MKRYEALAADIEESIRTGVLRPGDRLASVRHTSTSRGVSPSTVFQAYYLLEARGLIRARERSGYYVAGGIRALPPEPELTSQPKDESIALDVSERVFEILESSMARDVVPFGSAFPSPLLFPLARLGQAMAVERAVARPVEHGRRPDARQRGPAAPDRAALSGRRHARAHGRDRHHQRRAGGPDPLPGGGGAPGRCGGRRVADLLCCAAGARTHGTAGRSKCRPIRATASISPRWNMPSRGTGRRPAG